MWNSESMIRLYRNKISIISNITSSRFFFNFFRVFII